MVSWFYFFLFAACIFMIANFLRKNKTIDTLYMAFGIMIALYSMGYWLISISETLPQAVMTNKIMYVGAIYTPLLTILVLSRLCNIRFPKWMTAILTLIATVVIGGVMSIGHSTLYYKSVELGHGSGYNYLIKEYGPMHNIYTGLIIAYIFSVAYIVIYAIKHRNKVPAKMVTIIGTLGIVMLIIYMITRFLKSPFEWLTIFYLAAVIIITKGFERMNMYDMTMNIANSIERMQKYGFIVFDNKHAYINANDLVKLYFPEIDEWRTEKPVKESDSWLYTEVIMWYLSHSKGERSTKMVQFRNLYFELSIRDIIYGKKKVGDLLEIIERTEEHNYTVQIEEYNSRLSAEVEVKTSHINAIKDKMVIGMAAMIESRDNSTGGHIRRTSQVVAIFARKLSEHSEQLGINSQFLNLVVKAAPMHDLGKIAVNDAILCKKGKFTDEEYAQMKKHSEEGYKNVRTILEGIDDEEFIKIAENVAHYHHEKWNGRGYPCGLSGTDIPIEARIMALADVFDALVSKRCYKEAFDYDKAFDIIRKDLGSHFDPLLGEMFLECRDELIEMYDALKEEEN